MTAQGSASVKIEEIGSTIEYPILTKKTFLISVHKKYGTDIQQDLF